MSCNSNPQLYSRKNNFSKTNNNRAKAVNVNTDMRSSSTNTDFASIGPWGNTTPVNPNNPSSPASIQPSGAGTPFVDNTQLRRDLPETLTQSIYTPGYLMQHIGDLMRVEFLIGNNTTDRVGYLREVGASYIVLQAVNLGNYMMCDIYSIKFVTIMGTNISPDVATLFTGQL